MKDESKTTSRAKTRGVLKTIDGTDAKSNTYRGVLTWIVSLILWALSYVEGVAQFSSGLRIVAFIGGLVGILCLLYSLIQDAEKEFGKAKKEASHTDERKVEDDRG